MRILTLSRAAGLFAALALACLVATFAPPSAAEARGSHQLHAEWRLTGSFPEDPVCHRGFCRQYIGETLAYSGDLQGTSAIDAYYITNEHRPGWVLIPYTETFTGTIPACGTGTATWSGVLLVTPNSLSGNFFVLSGTGGLARLRGTGSLTVHPDGVSGGLDLAATC
jgi:hypothetical protein